MTIEASRPLSDAELLFGITLAPEAPSAPRLNDGWDWGQASKEEVEREAAYLLQYRERLKRDDHPFHVAELAKVERELELIKPAAERFRISMEIKTP